MEEKKSVALSLLILGSLVGLQAQIAQFDCASGEFLTAPSGFFASPNFPNSYSPHSTCTWNITVSSGYIIKVTFHAFSLDQAHPSCNWVLGTYVSNITMTNIASDDGRQPFQLCGQQIPAPVYSVGNSIQVTFASFTDQNSGFNASYTEITYESLCPNLTTTNETSGVITSPYYPRSHSKNQTCIWEITANKGKRIKLVMEEMSLGPWGLSCKFDYLEIQNGSYATDGAASEKTCNVLVGSVTYFSFHESMRIRFVSDGAFNGGRFMATYTQVPYVASNECSNYSLLNEGDRAKTFYNRSIAFRCDINISGWHRFSGQAGSQMAETCVSLYHCGTDAPGWLNGRHPAVTDGVVSRQVCFSSLFGCCTFSTSISVRNCGEFYVYKLKRPSHCYLRYCGSGLPMANECYNYKVLNESIRARTYNGAPAVLCDHSLVGWYRFSGAAGNQMTQSCVDSHGCGNFGASAGWLDGSHPAVTDGVVERRVCFRASSNCCPHLTYISVRNCGDFYIYKFKLFFVCNLGYCGDGVVPSTPADVLGYNTSSTSILIQWSNATEGHQNVMILNYTITYKELPNGSPQTKVVIAPTTQATLTGLNEYTNYSITVFASNAKGHGNSSNPIIGTTDEDTPSAPPSDVQANSAGSTSIFLQWGSVPVVDQNGVILGYAVTYKALPDSGPQTKVVSAPTTQATLTGLKNNTNYSITVLAFTVKGDGPASVPIVVIRDEDKPSAPPSDVRASSAGSTSIFVQWNNVPVSDQNGVILSYTVTYKALPGGSPQTNTLNAPTTQTTLTGLDKYTNYSITVFASTTNGNGPASVPTVVITDEDKPNAPPYNAQGNSTGSTSVVVQWDSVPVADRNGVILRYTVTYRSLPGGSPQANVVSAQTNQATLTGLNEFTNYSITVFASTAKGDGPASVPIYIITDEDKPNAPPSDVQGNNNGLISIFVQWGGVPVADQNGVILSYTVTYKALPDGSPQTKEVSAPTTQATMTGLKNNTNYSITVFASTVKGDGMMSTPIFVVTGREIIERVKITEEGNETLVCNTDYSTPTWSRRDETEVQTKRRVLIDAEYKLRITDAAISDSGEYICNNGPIKHRFIVSIEVLVKVEMVVKVLNYKYTPELQNKSSPVFKDTARNFTREMDKVYNKTPGYIRTEVLNFTKGSVKVDFRVIIVLVATDPKNESVIPDKKAETAHTVVVEAKTGFVKQLQVDPVVEVKTPPLEPRQIKIFDTKSDEFSIGWIPPEDSEAFRIDKYKVQHKTFGTGEYTTKELQAVEGREEYSYRIQNLEPATTYLIRVGAENVYGDNYNEEQVHKTSAAPFAEWIIVLIVLAAILIIAIIIGVVVCLRRKAAEERRREQMQVDARFGGFEDVLCMDSLSRYEEKHVKGLKFSYVNDSFKPSEIRWEEIPYENIILLDELGSGAFGVVYKGELTQKKGETTPCAVKALKASATNEEIRDLYNELEIMTNVGHHPNLVNLLGACTTDGHLLVVLEIAENGSLLDLLKKSRGTDENSDNINTFSGGLSEEMKLRIATDVAKGMAHLASCRCIHRDLAARNVLLGENYVAKVADYGMARDVYEQLMYKKETQGKLPVKWMAIESLETYVFTIESDVWSFGVLLWEIESKGLKPYAGMNTTELITELKRGYRLDKPRGCSDEMYQVMRDCWDPNPRVRPTFDQLVARLQSMAVPS